jgi:hypothetical protein
MKFAWLAIFYKWYSQKFIDYSLALLVTHPSSCHRKKKSKGKPGRPKTPTNDEAFGG